MWQTLSKNIAFWNWFDLLTKLLLSAFLNACEYHPNPTNQLLVMFLFSFHYSTLYIFVCLLQATHTVRVIGVSRAR